MKRSARRIDELRHFFLTENRGQAVAFLRIGSIGNAPWLLECLDVEESQGTEMVRNRPGRQLPFCEEVSLVLPNVLRAQAIGRTLEMLSEGFDLANVIACGSLRVITSLSF